MTGSGGPAPCLAPHGKAAIDGIPAILIDPKGDLANLLLTFPALRPEDFRAWINEDDARRKNVSPDDYAGQQAEAWQKGLASWGEDGPRGPRPPGAGRRGGDIQAADRGAPGAGP